LVLFLYIGGNHDNWQLSSGHTPLDKFRSVITAKVADYIEFLLNKNNLRVADLRNIVNKKIVSLTELDERYVLPSVLKIGMRHPETGRALTTTLRLQQAMGAMSDCQIVLIGNFHTAVAMTMWDPRLGERSGMQFGTLMHKTNFEEKKNKVVDFGIGCLRVWSHSGRIIRTQIMFSGKPSGKVFSNEDLLSLFEKKIGITD
jgi:hypothetical protein